MTTDPSIKSACSAQTPVCVGSSAPQDQSPPTVLVPTRRRIDIYFHANGKIDLTARVVKALSIREGDVINIMRHGTELYLFVERRASDIKCQMAHYRHACHSTSRGNNPMRCWSVAITRIISEATHSTESWLYVGNAKELSLQGRPVRVLPLIIGNNQYTP